LQAVNKYSEQELVTLLKQRQQVAFSYLYDNYSSALHTVVLNVIHNETLAADVLQEVFIKIFRQIDSYDETKGRLFTWMLNIARNASIDTIRSKAFQNSAKNNELTETHFDAAGSTQMNIDKIGLKKIVHTLKDEYKSLIELAYFQGYTQDEISKIVNIPLGTVKTRLRMALIQLKQQITV
jgi:RNA polymerase sigma factor (sigma-70 family)